MRMWQVTKSKCGQEEWRQKAQLAIVSKLSKTKGFNKISTGRRVQRQIEVQLQAQTKMPVKQKCSYCVSSHLPRWSTAYGKKCISCGKINYYKEVCRRRINKKKTQYQPRNRPVPENSIHFNSKHSVMTANIKTPSKQARVIVAYRVELGSDGNIMLLHIYKKYFP